MAVNLLLGSAVVTTFSAGCWQLKRLRGKERLVTDRSATLLGEPVQNTGFGPDLPPYTAVRLEGWFGDEGASFVGPRTPPKSANPAPKGNPPGYEIGVLVLAPFFISDPCTPPPARRWTLWSQSPAPNASRHKVLVNRGWIPWVLYEEWKQTGKAPKAANIHTGPTTLYAVTQSDESARSEPGPPVAGVLDRIVVSRLLNRNVPSDVPSATTSFVRNFHLEAIDHATFEKGSDPTLPLHHRKLPITRASWEFMFGYVSPDKHREYITFWFGSSVAIIALSYFARRRSPSIKGRPRLK
jgi:cytochrome oxidase assembly protein ShyY1